MLPIQIKAARGLLRMSQDNLSKKSGVSLPTIKRIESMKGKIKALTETVESIQTALEGEGVEFTTISDGKGEGVRLAKPYKVPDKPK